MVLGLQRLVHRLHHLAVLIMATLLPEELAEVSKRIDWDIIDAIRSGASFDPVALHRCLCSALAPRMSSDGSFCTAMLGFNDGKPCAEHKVTGISHGCTSCIHPQLCAVTQAEETCFVYDDHGRNRKAKPTGRRGGPLTYVQIPRQAGATERTAVTAEQPYHAPAFLHFDGGAK